MTTTQLRLTRTLLLFSTAFLAIVTRSCVVGSLQGNTDENTLQTTNAPPSVVLFNGAYWVYYRDGAGYGILMASRPVNQAVWTYRGYSRQTTSNGPAVVTLPGALYMFYVDGAGSRVLWASSGDGVNWSYRGGWGGAMQCNSVVHAASSGTDIMVVCVRGGQVHFQAKSGAYGQVAGAYSDAPPGIAWFQNAWHLYVRDTGPGAQSGGHIKHWTLQGGQSAWVLDSAFPTGFSTQSGLAAAAVQDKRLYMFYRDGAGEAMLFAVSMDGSAMYNPVGVGNRIPSFGDIKWDPAVAIDAASGAGIVVAVKFNTNVIHAVTVQASSANTGSIAAQLCPGTAATNIRLTCLASAYAPLLKFDTNEVYFPSSVDDFLPYMKITYADGSVVPNQPAPLSASNLGKQPTTETFLTTKSPLANDGATDDRFMLGRAPTGQNTVPIYTSIVRKQNGLIYDFVYYTFYPYNQGKKILDTVWGNHVGDWEHLTLRISFQNPLEPQITNAYLAQHDHGACLRIDDLTFVPNTPHPIFYVARGSHGLYHLPGRDAYKRIVDQTRLLGELVDEHNGNSAIQWETWKQMTSRMEDEPLASTWTWWSYNGRWGNKQAGREYFGQRILESGPTYPGSNTLAFSLDNLKFEECF